jgi:hypothetical protein
MTRRRGLGLDFVDALPPDGERRLMLAVLMDAVRLTRSLQARAMHRHLPLVKEQELHRELSWFFSSDRSHPFAFENICDALGLNADYIRRCVADRRIATSVRPVRRYAARVEESWLRQRKHGGRLYLPAPRRRKRRAAAAAACA